MEYLLFELDVLLKILASFSGAKSFFKPHKDCYFDIQNKEN